MFVVGLKKCDVAPAASPFPEASPSGSSSRETPEVPKGEGVPVKEVYLSKERELE